MTSFFLKIFALIFMVIDHVGFILFPGEIIFRAIGRLAFPLFAYQMAVGFSHTRNKPKHILKLLLFAILCQIPQSIINNMYNIDHMLNIIFTFIFALLIIYVFENLKWFKNNNDSNKRIFDFKNSILSTSIAIVLLCLGIFLNVDYGWYGILLTIAFYFTLNKKALGILLFFLLVNLNFIIKQSQMAFLAYISLFDIIFIILFNGKRGYKFSWIFYAFYFLHQFPLLFIKYYLI